MRLLPIIVVVLLAGCAGHETGPWDPGAQSAYYDDDSTHVVNNDSFYDGGVFDQNVFQRPPGMPR